METNPQGQTMYRSLGAPGVPVLIVDGDPIIGMDVEGWIGALADPGVELEPTPAASPYAGG